MKKIVKNLLLILFSIIIAMPVFADWVKVNNSYMYINNATGQYVKNNWIQNGNGYYFFDANGYIVTGWCLINGKYYYFNNDGLMQTGFVETNGKQYYLNRETGEMVTGWIQTYNDGLLDYYYFNSDGSMQVGWSQINNKWYYFKEGKALIDTWAQINSIWYHFNIQGVMETGWITQNGKMYHLNVTDGSLTKGWVQDAMGNQYYCSENDGSLAVNTTISINGITYTFDATGKCIAKNQYIADANNGSNILNSGGTVTGSVYGVNIGVSPDTNTIQGANASTATSMYSNEASLQAGQTSGPK